MTIGLNIKSPRQISKLTGAIVAVTALIVQPIVPLNLPAVFAVDSAGDKTTSVAAEPRIKKIGATIGDYGNYKGINVDVTYENIAKLNGLDVTIYRENGGPVTKSATEKLIAELNAANGQAIGRTTPIVVQNNTYDEAGSSSWVKPVATWDKTTVPSGVTVTMKFDDRPTESSPLTPVVEGNASYASMVPAIAPDVEAPTVSNVKIVGQDAGTKKYRWGRNCYIRNGRPERS